LLEKLEIKYGWKEVEMGNNASYRNLSRFELKFELKLKEVSLSWNRRKILELWISTKVGQQAPGYTLLQRKKSFSTKRWSEIWISLKKGNQIDFTIVWILHFIF
jgi:hypothetical protein